MSVRKKHEKMHGTGHGDIRRKAEGHFEPTQLSYKKIVTKRHPNHPVQAHPGPFFFSVFALVVLHFPSFSFFIPSNFLVSRTTQRPIIEKTPKRRGRTHHYPWEEDGKQHHPKKNEARKRHDPKEGCCLFICQV